jgi:hypothetical protein
VQKEEKKKYKKLWNNTISLQEYRGNILIDMNYVLDRRKADIQWKENYLIN